MDNLGDQKRCKTPIVATPARQSPQQGGSRRSDEPLQGAQTLDLYLSEIGRNVAAIGGQSVLLAAAIKAQMELLREIDRGQAGPATRVADLAGPRKQSITVNSSGIRPK